MQRLIRLITLSGASKSLWGHVVFFQIVFALPMLALVLFWDYQDGTLSAELVARHALISAAAGAFMAFACWHVVTLPILRRTGRKP